MLRSRWKRIDGSQSATNLLNYRSVLLVPTPLGVKRCRAVFFIWSCRRKELAGKTKKTITTKDLADNLGVDVKTIQRAVDSLDLNVERVGSSHTMIFNEAQATAVKIELQNHTKIARNGYDTLSISNDLEAWELQKRLDAYKDRRIAELQAENEAQKQQLLEQAPKVEFYDDVAGSSDTIDMKEVAKVLNVKGFGRNNIFELLRCRKILDNNNQPYQKYVDSGYFRVIESRYTLPTGEVKISLKTVVFQKGLDFIRKLIAR